MSHIDFWSLLSSLVTGPATLGYMFVLTDHWRFSKKKRNIILLSTVFLVSLLEIMIFLHANNTNNIRHAKSDIAIIDFIYTSILSLVLASWRQGRSLFVLFTAVTCSFFCSPLVSQLSLPYGPLRLLMKIGVNLLFMYLLRRYFLPCLHGVHPGGRFMWYKLSIIPLLYYTAFGFTASFRSLSIQAPAYIATLLVLLSTYTMFYCFLNSVSHRAILQRDNAILQNRIATLHQAVTEDKALQHRHLAFRADMEDFLLRLSASLEQQDRTQMNAILQTLGERIAQAQHAGAIITYTGNSIIDSALSSFADRTALEDISLHISLHLPESDCLDTAGLAVVLYNALENAFHACLALPPNHARKIELVGSWRRQQFFLHIRNTFEGVVQFDAVTGCPVASQEGHGCGTQSILAFVRKHNGHLQFSTEDGWFSMRLLL